jgi:secretion/DNA translocation related CpaE-like protein
VAGMITTTALLITRDELLLDDLLRLAAAAGCRLEVAHDAPAGLRAWSSATVVLVGVDLASRVAEQRPPRREQVHVVGHGPAPDDAFRHALGAGAVDVVELPGSETWLVEVLTDAGDAVAGRRAGRAHTVGVVAGSGGVGATTFACALALTAAASRAATLVDLDPLGPGVDRVVGLDGADGVRWDGLVTSRGRLSSHSLRTALPTKDGLAVLTWEMGAPTELDAASVREVLSATQRGNDLVIVDLPRALDDVTAEVVTRCDRVLLVTDPTVAGVASAGKVAAVLRSLNPRVEAVVRAGRGTLPAAQVADALGLPLVADVPRHRRLAEHVDLGLGPVHGHRSALARAARTTLGLRSRQDRVA